VSYPFERSFYRIQYPFGERPRLLLDGQSYSVVDCSELGLRYVHPSPSSVEVGHVVRGVLTFHRGAQVVVEGEVVRIQGDQVAVHLSVTPVPLGLILDEQRHLRANYRTRS
jgi:hypothetical protein